MSRIKTIRGPDKDGEWRVVSTVWNIFWVGMAPPEETNDEMYAYRAATKVIKEYDMNLRVAIVGVTEVLLVIICALGINAYHGRVVAEREFQECIHAGKAYAETEHGAVCGAHVSLGDK